MSNVTTPSSRAARREFATPGPCQDRGMNESPVELDGLQRLLDDSITSAGGHLRKIITGPRRLTARQLVAALTGMKVLVVATVNPAGQPRTSCVDGHFLHGTWIFGTAAIAQKAR